MTEAEFIAAGLPFPHGFFTRRGGVSQGPYASLNCALAGQDSREAVLENRARAARALGADPAELIGLTQVHGIEVARVERLQAQALGVEGVGQSWHRSSEWVALLVSPI